MAQDGISTVLLRYEVDRQSLNQASLASIRVRSDMQFIAQQAKQVDLASVKAGQSIRDAFGSQGSGRLKELTGATETATKQMNRLKESVTGVQQEIKSLSSIKAADIVDPELSDIVGGGGGIRGAQQGIRLAGSKLRALPSMQIPGAGGLGTDAIANVIRLVGSVPPVFLAVGAAAAVMGASVVALNLILGDSKAAMDAAVVGNKAYYDLIRDKTTSGELRSKITELADKLAADNEELGRITSSFTSGFNTAIKENVAGTGTLIYTLSQLSNADDETTKRADELRKSISEGSETLKTLTREQGSAAVTANDLKAATEAAAKAEQELATARANNAVALDQSRINAQIQAASLQVNGTEKQVQDLIDGYARQKEILMANLPILQAELAATKAGTGAHDAYQKQIDGVTLRLADLDTNMLTLAGDTLQAAKANDIAAEAEKKRADSIKAVAKYNDDIVKINDQEAQKEVDLATKYADKQVDIAAKAVEDASKLLDSLEQKLAGLNTDVNRDLEKDARKAQFDALQEQVKFQHDEVVETEKHYQDLDRIRRQAQAQEFEQGLDRDFAGLAKSRRATALQITESNISFNEDRKSRLESFTVKHNDDQAQFAFERSERLIKFDQDVSDARAQYIRERLQLADSRNKQLAAAKAAYDKDLALLQSKYRAELTARDSAIRTELQMIQAGNTARLQLESQLQQQYLTILRNAANSAGVNVSSGASGAGFSSLPGGVGGVQSSGNAIVGSIGGIFGANKSTTAPRGGMSVSVPISITTGGSPQQIAAIVPAIGKIVEEKLTDYHRSVYGA